MAITYNNPDSNILKEKGLCNEVFLREMSELPDRIEQFVGIIVYGVFLFSGGYSR